MRRLLLWGAQNRWLATHVPRWRFAQRAVRRFLPGEGFESALKAAVDFRKHNIGALFTLLGENVTDLTDANQVVEQIQAAIFAQCPGSDCHARLFSQLRQNVLTVVSGIFAGKAGEGFGEDVVVMQRLQAGLTRDVQPQAVHQMNVFRFQ